MEVRFEVIVKGENDVWILEVVVMFVFGIDVDF